MALDTELLKEVRRDVSEIKDSMATLLAEHCVCRQTVSNLQVEMYGNAQTKGMKGRMESLEDSRGWARKTGAALWGMVLTLLVALVNKYWKGQ